MDFEDLDEEKVYEAIRQGVADGIFRIATNASDMPTHDFFNSIKDGVKAAVKDLGVRLVAVEDDNN